MITSTCTISYYIPAGMLIGQDQGTSGGLSYFATDGLGSVRGTYSNSGINSSVSNFDPYGSILPDSGASGINSHIGYTGALTDANGLVYLNARYYNPSDADFLSSDPLAGKVADPGSFNLYGYVRGNPINAFDLSGKQPVNTTCIEIQSAIDSAAIDPVGDPDLEAFIAEEEIFANAECIGNLDLPNASDGGSAITGFDFSNITTGVNEAYIDYTNIALLPSERTQISNLLNNLGNFIDQVDGGDGTPGVTEVTFHDEKDQSGNTVTSYSPGIDVDVTFKGEATPSGYLSQGISLKELTSTSGRNILNYLNTNADVITKLTPQYVGSAGLFTTLDNVASADVIDTLDGNAAKNADLLKLLQTGVYRWIIFAGSDVNSTHLWYSVELDPKTQQPIWTVIKSGS